MNNLPRAMLRKILVKYGKGISSDARRCEGLLNDLCGSYRREINVLVSAIDERIPLDLLAGASSINPELLLTRLEKRLEEQTALTGDAARWAVESWALALDIITEEMIEEIRRKQSNATSIKPETIDSSRAKNKTTNGGSADFNRPTQPPLPKMPPSFPLPSTNAPPVNRQQAKMPPLSPPSYSPVNNPPPIQTPSLSPPIHQPSAPAPVSRRGSFLVRGCLIVLFLFLVGSVILFLGVPYAIEVMRETQRERNNEPPRFPTR